MGTPQPGPGAKHGVKTEGTRRRGLAAASLGPARAIPVPSPSQGTGGRLHVLDWSVCN